MLEAERSLALRLGFRYLLSMSVLEMKQEILRLTKREREELFAYLVRLRHDTPEWKRATAQQIRNMKKGKAVTSDQIETRIKGR